MKKSIANERLELKKIEQYIDGKQLNSLSAIEIFDVIDSTNTYLLQKAKQGFVSPMVCLAEEQTQGRGRLGRSWYSPPFTNIYCSLLWQFSSSNLMGLSLAVAVILAVFFNKIANINVQLKWPNDVFFANRKLAGILIESLQPNLVVIGIGVNLSLPEKMRLEWIDLTSIVSGSLSRNHLVGALINELLPELEKFDRHGLKEFLENWQQHDMLKDQLVSIITPNKSMNGIMYGINSQGELLLKDNGNKIHTFCVGEVSVRSTCSLSCP